jgi:predicted ArsR family transcriptional regulator|tara:strand:+ start:900 stop:1202 length:303 start_codon:yes stop_codon:yes gene_type:complete
MVATMFMLCRNKRRIIIMTSLKSKILSSLKEGNEVSGKQFAARHNTGVNAVAARVSELRREGYAIYNNKKTDSQGRVSMKYRIGAPTRKVVAAGYAALGA